jgi:ATP-dependent Clp protease ATP-binding subunit ClpA
VIFNQLTRDDLKGIVDIQLENLRKRLDDLGISIEMTDRALDAVASEGYDPQFGARPLKRVIQQRIENPLATRILTGVSEEGDTVRVDYEHENFTFSSGSDKVGKVPAEIGK